MDVKGKNIVVVGLARTGAAVCRYLVHEGAHVTGTDVKPEGAIDCAEELRRIGVEIVAGGHREAGLPLPRSIATGSFLSADLIVVSPGVPPDQEPLRRARERGIPIISEIELASSRITEPIIGITGTNGKSTTTALLGRMFSEAGIAAFVGGNIGTPLIDYTGGARFVVAELSNFQLEGTDSFRPFIAVMLNLTEDHLDRYPGIGPYRLAKERIFRNQRRSDYAVLNLDDPIVREMKGKTRARVYWFSSSHAPRKGIVREGTALHVRDGVGGEEPLSIERIKAPAVMPENVMAAALSARLCGVERGAIQRAIEGFRGLPHRCEWIAEINGATYYDDSKGTNVGAAVRALQSIDPPVILIAGGRDKGGDYAPLKPLVKDRVKSVILIGEARDKIARTLTGLTDIVLAGSMDEAVAMAHQRAGKNDNVLLSPACSSFDMFANYEERGAAFQEAVRRAAEDCPLAGDPSRAQACRG